jgi:serine/threonine protein kinase
VDLWSLGAIVYRMISGQLPPRPSSTTNRSFPKPSASLVCTVSPSLLDLLDRLLQPNPEIRIDWKEFLAHPYVASLNSTSSHNLSTSSLSLDPPLPHLYPTQHELSEPSEEILHNFEFSAFDVNDTPTDNNQSTDNNTNVLPTHT